jgi:glutathione peroxidase-family protein
MSINHSEQRTVELNEIDLRFCKLCIIVMANPCGFTQQLGEYSLVKLEVRLKNMSVLGVKCVVTYPNLFTLLEQEDVKLLSTTELYNDQNECKLEDR